MSDTLHCPDCGHENPPDRDECANCGFPLTAEATGEVPAKAEPSEPAIETPPLIRRPPRRPPRSNTQVTSLWLVFGTFAALSLVWVAIKANVDRATKPVEGASPAQQADADSVLREVMRDSTNVRARAKLGDVLFDTANWSDAIVQYRAAIRMDSSLTSTIVDLGVCYFNLGDAAAAERHFLLALARDPRHPVALFNLGIVYETRKEYPRALDLFRRSLATEPHEEMRKSIADAVTRVEKQMSGK